MSDDVNKDIMNSEMKDVKIPTLTLNPEQNIEDETNGTQERAGAVDESMLSEEEKKQVEAFAAQIDVTDIKMVNSYGASVQNGIASFSTSITANQKTKEFGEVGDSLSELRVAINSTNAPEKKGILGFFQRGKNKVSYLIMKLQKKILKKLRKICNAIVKFLQRIFIFMIRCIIRT